MNMTQSDADTDIDIDTNDKRMTIYRASEAPSLAEAACMQVEPYANDAQRDGMKKLVEAGLLEGDEIRILCDQPGFHLTHAWFKPGYPLPLHSHDADCVYFITSGTLRLGTEELGPKDVFFVPAGVPYTYKPGPAGVEVLEIRQQGAFNFRNLAKGAAFYQKAAESIEAHRGGWKTAVAPSR